MTLNRWQRVWIVTSLLLLLPVAIATWLTLPSPEPVKTAWSNAALVVLKGYDDRGWPSVAALRQSLYPGLDDEDIIRRARSDVETLHQRHLSRGANATSAMLLDIAIVDDYYGRQLALLRARQVRRAARGGTIWLILVVLAYGAAFASRYWKRRAPLLHK